MEGRKNQFDGAEFDEQFIERIGEVRDEEMRSYLQTLPEEARKAIKQANNAAIAKWIVRDYMEWLTGIEII